MRKVHLLALAALIVLGGCTERKNAQSANDMAQTDSLKRIIAQRDTEIDDMMGTLNEIQEGFRVISEAENRLTIAKDGEGSNRRAQIREDIRFISSTMAANRELIQKLRKQLKDTRFNGEQLQKTIEALTTQMEQKDQELQRLRAELDAKDIHIAELDERVNTLHSDVGRLEEDQRKKAETISAQDKQINTAWFVYGTKRELKDQHVLVDGKVLQSNFNKSYFTRIDIRVDKEIKLYSKSARLLTMHPSDSYTLTRDASGQYVLRITTPQLFWSTSKYLVILVK